ncbi:MFS transporter [Novosphingobium sp. ERN07]|uniref:MFS transporter n=1 Tax=Novosphingobium sp. ERN07 TaxID=2726187 RepID=UPI0014564EF1|nr:MFS transporter [Novosphingobium sp. ERN07]NLR70316.1 MFS transporter [Novosphingobium sp. ERN07]
MSSLTDNELAKGWRVLAGSFIGVGIGVSSLYFYSLGVFIKPLAAEFGWSRGQASLGALVGTACAALMSPVIGRIADRAGSLKVAIMSLLLLAGGFAAHAVLVTGLTSFLAVTALLSLATAGSSPLPYTRLTVASFDRHRGLALGLVLGGTGLGAILIPRFLVPYVGAEGWRAGYLALGLAALAGTPFVALLLRSVPDLAICKPAPLSFAMIRQTRGFLSLASMFLLAAVAILGTVVQFVPMLTDAGLGPEEAGGIAALIGASAIVGRLAIGVLLDRLPANRVSAGLFAVASTGLFLMSQGGMAMAVPGALITGVAVGAEVDLLSFLTSRYFPKPAFGQVNGILYAVFLVGGALGPYISGFLYDLSGDYGLSLVLASTLLAIAAAIGWLLPPPYDAA